MKIMITYVQRSNDMKKLITFIMAFVLLFALSACDERTEAEKIADSYSSLESADHVFDLIDFDELDELVESDEKMIVYFGAPI